LARTIYPSCEKPYTRYTTNTRGPIFSLPPTLPQNKARNVS
jgi:hypothetical protein